MFTLTDAHNGQVRVQNVGREGDIEMRAMETGIYNDPVVMTREQAGDLIEALVQAGAPLTARTLDMLERSGVLPATSSR